MYIQFGINRNQITTFYTEQIMVVKDNNLSEQTDRQTEAVIEQLWKVASRVIDRQTGRVIELTTKEMERNEQSDQQTSAPIELATNVQKNKHKLQPGQQSVKAYFKVTDRQSQAESYFTGGSQNFRTSDIVTSDEGRKKLFVVERDVVGLFPEMKEVNTGRAVAKQVLKSPLVVKGVEYEEVTRYVAGSRKLCGDLIEVENVLPWRRKSGK